MVLTFLAYFNALSTTTEICKWLCVTTNTENKTRLRRAEKI